MDIIDNLTNEKISKKFNNQFDLVNYAIKLAGDMIETGRSPRVKMQTENPALLILEEIAEGKDQLVIQAQVEGVKKEMPTVEASALAEDIDDEFEDEEDELDEEFEDEVEEEALSE